jgi:hypothetical protein
MREALAFIQFLQSGIYLGLKINLGQDVVQRNILRQRLHHVQDLLFNGAHNIQYYTPSNPAAKGKKRLSSAWLAGRSLWAKPGVRMCSGVDLAQLADVEFGIDLRGVQVGVAQELLNVPDVHAVFEHVRGARVPEEVATARAADLGFFVFMGEWFMGVGPKGH